MRLTLLGLKMRQADLDSAVQELGTLEGPMGLHQIDSVIKS